MFAFDRECKLIAWNRAMQRISGLSADEVLGKRVVDFFPFLREPGSDACFSAALEGKNFVSQNHPYGPSETGVFESHYSPLYDEHDRIAGGIAVITDITARKQAEEAAHTAYRQLEFHVENSPLAVVEWDSDFRVSRWSESAERLFGWKADEVIGKHVNEWRFVFADDADAVALVTNRQREGVEVQGIQRNRNYTRDGGVIYCEWYNSVLRDDRGKLVSVLSLVLDVTARQSAEEERAAALLRERDARRHAEEADRLKDEFLATLSHELRTPLTPVVGWIKLLRSGTLDEKSVLQALDAIERNAWLQSRLIDDLLDTSRIATGKLHFEPKPTDLNVVVRAAVDTVRASAAARNLELSMSLHPTSLVVMGEPVRLQQIAWNLVSNAIKFTDPGGKVNVSTGLNGTQAYLTVVDTGVGIEPEFLPHVFDRFRQADGSTSRRHGGLGLGLAIADALAKMHGGRLEAQSGGVGQGATFNLRVELATTENVVSEKVDQKVHSLDGLDVLIVEDSEDTLLLLSTIFRREGANVITAGSASEALQSAIMKRPHIIVSDIGMPETDGYQLLEQLRLLPGLRDVPAIAISGYASEEDRERALAAGYLALVPKPVDVELLFNLIHELKAPAV